MARYLRFIVLMTFLFITFHQSPVLAGEQERIVVLPFTYIGVDETSMLSAQSILRMEIENIGGYRVLPDAEVEAVMTDTLCSERDCILEVGRLLQADKIIACNFAALGEKIVVHYRIFEVATGEAMLSERTTVLLVEDLDTVMKRIAISIAELKPIDQTAQVGAIMASEAVPERRRTSRRSAGFLFGYFYPSEGYDNLDRSLSLEFRLLNELGDFETGTSFALRKGVAVNLFVNYLTRKDDVCPYIGGGFGFHWVAHEYQEYYYPNGGFYEYPKEKKKDGFEFLINGGMKLFRTYNFQILLNLGYSYAFNDFNDQAMMFTIGLLR